jgi:hypothetical protein
MSEYRLMAYDQEPNGLWKCDECHKKFESEDSVKEHIKVNHRRQ